MPTIFTESDFADAPTVPGVEASSPQIFTENDFADTPTTPSIWSDPIGALTSADWWTSPMDGSPKKLTAQEQIAGPLLSALNGGALNFGDEIIGGGNALLDALLRGDNIGDAYDRRVQEARDIAKKYGEESPIASKALELSGALKMPVPNVLKPGVGVKPFVENVARSAALGGTYGAVSGFGSGEGGISNRLDSAEESGKTGATIGGIVGVPLAGLQQLLSGAAPKAEEWAKSLDRKSIGARQSDYQKTANDLGIMDLPDGSLQTLTKTTIDDLLSSGKLGASRNPSDLLNAVNAQSDDLSTKVGEVIQGFDRNVGAPVVPSFDGALQYLAEGKVPADKVDSYLKRLGDLQQKIVSEGQGKLSYLQQQKVAHGQLWDPNDTVMNGFNRMIYSDLQKTIENVVPEVAPLNAELQKFKIVKPILERSLAATETKDAMTAALQGLRTSGGFGVPILAGGLSFGGIGALGGGAAALAGSYLRSPSGMAKIAETLRNLPEGVGAGIKAVTLPSALLASASTQPEQKTASQSKKQGSQEQSTSSNSAPNPSANQLSSFIDNAMSRAEAKMSDTPETPKLAKVKRVSDLMDSLPPLVQAVIHVESGTKDKPHGDPSAVSKKGAVGLMQIMPATGKEWHRKLGLPGEYDPKDPAQNVLIGTAYLNYLMDEFDGDEELALTAYNQGPQRVKNLLKATGGDSLKDIIDRLGPDGRAYAKKVLARFRKLGGAVEV